MIYITIFLKVFLQKIDEKKETVNLLRQPLLIIFAYAC